MQETIEISPSDLSLLRLLAFGPAPVRPAFDHLCELGLVDYHVWPHSPYGFCAILSYEGEELLVETNQFPSNEEFYPLLHSRGFTVVESDERPFGEVVFRQPDGTHVPWTAKLASGELPDVHNYASAAAFPPWMVEALLS